MLTVATDLEFLQKLWSPNKEDNFPYFVITEILIIFVFMYILTVTMKCPGHLISPLMFLIKVWVL